MHTRDDGYFFGLPGAGQALVERLDRGFPAHRGEHRHVQRTANLVAAAPRRSFAFERAAVPIQRGNADEPA